jgi:sigma-B regulation protein RsbU (phosphoserine phosphatase)
MVLWRKESKSCQLINPNGLALGIEKGPLFEKLLQENTVQLSQGDRFTLYTDGVTESMNLEKKQFGQNRLYLLINQLSDRSSSEFLTRLTFEMDVHQGKASQDDDVTIVTGRAV